MPACPICVHAQHAGLTAVPGLCSTHAQRPHATDAMPAGAASPSKALEGDSVDQATTECSLKGVQLGYYCHVCAHNTWMLLVHCLQRVTSLYLYLDLEFQFLLDADHLLCSAHLPDTFITCFHHLGKRK